MNPNPQDFKTAWAKLPEYLPTGLKGKITPRINEGCLTIIVTTPQPTQREQICPPIYECLKTMDLPHVHHIKICSVVGDQPDWIEDAYCHPKAKGYSGMHPLGNELYQDRDREDKPLLLMGFPWDQTDTDLEVEGEYVRYDLQCQRQQQLLTSLKTSSYIPDFLEKFELLNGDRYVVMELPYKGALLSHLKLFPSDRLYPLLDQLLGLVVHLQRDHTPPLYSGQISPDNLWINNGETLQLCLVRLDQCQRGNLTDPEKITSLLLQESPFIPPERRDGKILNSTSDLYSVGLIMICAITGLTTEQLPTLMDNRGHINFNHDVFSDRKAFPPALLRLLKSMVSPTIRDRPMDGLAAQTQWQATKVAPLGPWWSPESLEQTHLRSALFRLKIGSCPVGPLLAMGLTTLFLVPSLYLGGALGLATFNASVAMSETILQLWPPKTIEVDF